MKSVKDYKQKWFDFTDYEPHLGQKSLHFPPKNTRFTVACCGRRWGKSFSAAKEVEVVVTQKNKHVWIVAPTYGTSERIFKMVWDELIIKQNMPTRRKSLNDQFIEFEWGSSVQGKSSEHPTQLIGMGLDLLVIDEAAKINLKTIWQMYLRPTLSDRKGKAIFISTPQGFNSFHELYKLAETEKAWYSFNSPSYQNLYAFPKGKRDSDLKEAKRTLSKEIYEQEYLAAFTSLSGRVYSDFSRESNVRSRLYNSLYPVYVGIDFGFRLPGVVFFQCFKEEINNSWSINVIDEIVHQPNLKITELADRIKSKNYRITQVFGDPAGYQVQSSVGVGEADLFYKSTGYRVWSLRDKASRSINSGISHVRSFIKSANGERRLFIDSRCRGIIEDLETYRYPEHKEGQQLRDVPLKDGYSEHGADALRYGIVNRFPIRNYKFRTEKR